MKRILLSTAICLAMPLAAMAQSNTMAPAAPAPTTPGTSTMSSSTMSGMTTGTASQQDKHFVRAAAIAGMAEVSDGQLAETKGSAAVQAVGQKMVADHTQANNQLMSIAKGADIMVPASVDAKHAAIHKSLTGLSGAAFNSKYLSTEKMGHEQVIALFQKEAADGTDPQLKSFASTTLPTLQQHLSMIEGAMK